MTMPIWITQQEQELLKADNNYDLNHWVTIPRQSKVQSLLTLAQLAAVTATLSVLKAIA